MKARRVARVVLAAAAAIATTTAAAQAAQVQQTFPRAADDARRDTTSKPLDVLAFLGLEPGMRVLDVFAGDGYYSEVAAYVTGSSGKVYLHNSLGSMQSLSRVQQRLAGGRLPNVEPVTQELETLLLPAGSIDLVLLVKVYHDLYYDNHGWSVAPDAAFRTLYRLLKPGGVLGVIDHEAPAGTGTDLVQRLHRIDPAFARADIESRGFVFEADSTLLRAAADPLTVPVFDPSVRGRTSRFVHRYRKPAPAPSSG